jgi:mannose/fructose/N-acetylgalactosamine-specific phosphotransferase system component IIC
MYKDTGKYMVQLTYASSVGFAMILAIFGSLFLGNYLDRKFGTGNILSVLFLLIGVAGALISIYNFIRRNFPNESEALRSIKSDPHPKRPAPVKN